MADKLKHRGKHPEDDALFGEDQQAKLQQTMDDYCYLMSRHYAEQSSLKLVGDHLQLTSRQRKAIQRGVSTPEQTAKRRQKEVTQDRLAGQSVCIDGYNILITVESLLSNGYVFLGRDGVYRDIASIHGTYRKVEETQLAIQLIGDILCNRLRVSSVKWFLDSPVSNSGRLKTMLCDIAGKHNWSWQVELVNNPDAELVKIDDIILTSDSWILDNCHLWFNLVNTLVDQQIIKNVNIIKL